MRGAGVFLIQFQSLDDYIKVCEFGLYLDGGSVYDHQIMEGRENDRETANWEVTYLGDDAAISDSHLELQCVHGGWKRPWKTHKTGCPYDSRRKP